MKSTLKILVPLVILAGVIFGLTFVSLYTPTPDDPDGKKDPAASKAEPPLRFFSQKLSWNPNSDNLAEHSFPGYFEAGTKGHTAEFWFENRNPSPVTLQLAKVSCSACTAGAVAAIPNESLKKLLEMHKLIALPFGPLPVSGLGSAVGAAQLLADLKKQEWQQKEFHDMASAHFEVPAAPPGGSQWGILRLSFQARPPVEERTLTANFVAQAADRPELAASYDFAVHFFVANPFEVNPGEIKLGEMSRNSETRSFDLYAVSSTRPPAEFPPPKLDVRDANTQPVRKGETFVSVGEPVLLTDKEKEEVAVKVWGDRKQAQRLLTAYRIPLVVAMNGGADAVDIGPVERVVWIAGPGQETKKVTLRGTIKGNVWLAEGGVMDLGSYSARADFEKRFTVISEQAGAELAWVKAETRPAFLEVRVSKPTDEGDRGHYQVYVKVPKESYYGPLPSDSVVVLEMKGPKPQRIRIPLKGSGELRR